MYHAKTMVGPMPAKGPDRPVYEVAPPLVSGHGSKRVDPRRKWSERTATLLTHGDPRFEPASSRRSFSSWPPRVRSHPGRLRSPPGATSSASPSSRRCPPSQIWSVATGSCLRPPRSAVKLPPAAVLPCCLRRGFQWTDPHHSCLLPIWPRTDHLAAITSSMEAGSQPLSPSILIYGDIKLSLFLFSPLFLFLFL
jgi:hypothetical protein